MIVRRLTVAAVIGLCLTSATVESQTISPQKVLGRYQQFIWQDRHGLPQNTVTDILRARDGYLWLGTFEGVVRFDGVRFTVFDSSNTREFRSSWITDLLEDRQGNLWFGTSQGGLVRLTDGAFTHYGTGDGLPDDRVMTLLEDRAGDLWIGTYRGGVSRFHEGRFTNYAGSDGLPAGIVWALAEDGEGTVWIGTGSGLASFDGARFTRYTVRDGLADDVRALCWDKDGKLWIGTQRGLTWLHDGAFVQAGRDKPIGDSVAAIFQDREGSVWVGTRATGLYRFAGERVSNYRGKDGLPGDDVETIYQDPDGDLWIGMNGSGLSQFREGRFRMITTDDGLVHDVIRAIYEDSAGAVWIGTDQGLSRLVRGAFTTYTNKDGLAGDTIRAIAEDTTGAIWIGTTTGLSRFRDGRFETWTDRSGLSNRVVVALSVDRGGNVWIGTEGGLHRFRDGRFEVFTSQDGLPDHWVQSLFVDREGSLWIGLRYGGMSRFKEGRFTNWSTKDGLADDRVIAFHQDDSGALWVGAHGGGLTRFKYGQLRVITVRDGLYDNLAFRILADDRGDLWMVCNRGIYRASMEALNAFADGEMKSVPSFVYGIADGMLSREGNGGQPAGWKTRDGRLWFATVAGVAVLDPTRQNLEPPLVAIEGATLDREAMPLGEALRILPGQANLEIQYTGLSWSRPQQIKFKYRLEGFDRDWVDAGTRRTAYYPQVPPGNYTFQVTADNGEGVWNATGSRLAVVVVPAFYQTSWFRAMTGMTGVAIVGLLWHLRVRHLKRAQGAQRLFSRRLIASQERERQRIAGELHDSLGQQLLIIKTSAVMGSASASSHAELQGQFDQIAASAGQSLDEVRQIAYNLRPYHLDRLGLTKALEAMIQQVAETSGLSLDARLTPIDDLFSKEAEITIFRIVQESLNNIVKHSHASQGNVTVERHARLVTIVVRDNGRGFDAQWSAVSQNGGFGLVGMAERVRILGGVRRIQATPGEGTTITITLDTSHARDQDPHVH